MFPESEHVYCPFCDVSVNKRDLRTEYLIQGMCRVCGTELLREEHISVKNEDLTLQEDASAIGVWLDSLTSPRGLTITPIRAGEGLGKYLWSVKGAHPRWRCEAVYQKNKSGVVELRLATPEHFEVATRNVHELQAILAKHGVEPCGVRATEDSWWGAAQQISTSVLSEALFTAVLSRLAGAMEEASEQFSGK